MFDDTSRYAKLPIKTWVDVHGREHAYVARRIIPTAQQIVAQATVHAGERIDLLATRAYGDPRTFWRIGDVNPNRDPDRLTDVPGRKLNIATIQAE